MPAKQSLPHVWVSLTIGGASFNPDDVSAQLGVEPTSSHRTGDPIVGNQGRRLRDRWRVTIGPCDTLEIGPMLSELLTHMAPGEQMLKQMCVELGVKATLTCAVEPTSSLTPNILFPSDVISWAASHDVDVDVDVMLWGENGDEAGARNEEHG